VIQSLVLWLTSQAVEFPNNQTKAYCALATSFRPCPILFENILDYCSQTQVPSLSCNNTYCGLSSNVKDDFTSLENRYIQLSGSIPTQIGYLRRITVLVLSFNQLTGTIPTQIGNLESISILGLSFNTLSGTIPTQIGYLRRSTFLVLSSNQLSGTIPTQIGNLESISYLALTANQLSGTIPTQIGNFKGITYL